MGYLCGISERVGGHSLKGCQWESSSGLEQEGLQAWGEENQRGTGEDEAGLTWEESDVQVETLWPQTVN